MPLTLERKSKVVEEISKQFEEHPYCLVANPVGMTVKEVSDLRNRLREKGVTLKVYKNRLIRRAIEGRGEAGDLVKLFGHLKGPSALAFTKGDPIVATKVFADFAAENEKLELKAAVYQMKYWDNAQIKDLAKLGSMAAVYGRLISAMKAPMYKLVYVLNAPGSKLVGTLKALAEKGE
jgi:large subunit ribosomal protein L10